MWKVKLCHEQVTEKKSPLKTGCCESQIITSLQTYVHCVCVYIRVAWSCTPLLLNELCWSERTVTKQRYSTAASCWWVFIKCFFLLNGSMGVHCLTQREERTVRGKFTSWGAQWLLFQTGYDIIMKDFGTGRSWCGLNLASPPCKVEDGASLYLSIHLLIHVHTAVTAEVRFIVLDLLYISDHVVYSKYSCLHSFSRRVDKITMRGRFMDTVLQFCLGQKLTILNK